MRPHHIVAIVTALTIGLGVKLFFVSAPTAEANVEAVKVTGIDVARMPMPAGLPLQQMHDMSFVFSDSD
ncbi:MAG: hypothetical protein K2Z80_21185 [Xanthobacteraceae bacterium]|nr:hypothetical protein [Xanthobacteraceae bacterium]